jgi:hypothetical protein
VTDLKVRATTPPTMAIRVRADATDEVLSVWPMSTGKRRKYYRTDVLLYHPPEGVFGLRTGLQNGGLIDLAPGIRKRIVAYIKVVPERARFTPKTSRLPGSRAMLEICG